MEETWEKDGDILRKMAMVNSFEAAQVIQVPPSSTPAKVRCTQEATQAVRYKLPNPKLGPILVDLDLLAPKMSQNYFYLKKLTPIRFLLNG